MLSGADWPRTGAAWGAIKASQASSTRIRMVDLESGAGLFSTKEDRRFNAPTAGCGSPRTRLPFGRIRLRFYLTVRERDRRGSPSRARQRRDDGHFLALKLEIATSRAYSSLNW